MTKPPALRVLVVCGVDAMAWVLLRPFLESLLNAGWVVDVACNVSSYREDLERLGVTVHHVDIQRRFNPFTHIRPIWQLLNLTRRHSFHTVNLHGVLGAYLGRIACWLAGQSRVLYFVHGFYFHENMNAMSRSAFIAVEWFLGRCTNGFVFVSGEDFETAIHAGIVMDRSMAAVAYNGVDTSVFCPPTPAERLSVRSALSIPDDSIVIGIVGRIVREKGHAEFLDMAECVLQAERRAIFLVVGDSLPSDRDQFGSVFRSQLKTRGVEKSFRCPGMVPDVEFYLKGMDLFVLPSYREGFPRSVLEAMSTGLPVVATRIRGCREAVLQDETGVLVPVADSAALTEAVLELVRDRPRAARMGQAGRVRVLHRFTVAHVQREFLRIFNLIAAQ